VKATDTAALAVMAAQKRKRDLMEEHRLAEIASRKRRDEMPTQPMSKWDHSFVRDWIKTLICGWDASTIREWYPRRSHDEIGEMISRLKSDEWLDMFMSKLVETPKTAETPKTPGRCLILATSSTFLSCVGGDRVLAERIFESVKHTKRVTGIM